MEYSPWFPRNIKPVHRGVYEIGEPYASPWFRLWDGKNWHYGSRTPKLAKKIDVRLYSFDANWRGLAHKPKAR